MKLKLWAGLNIYKKIAVIFTVLVIAAIASILLVNEFLIMKNYQGL